MQGRRQTCAHYVLVLGVAWSTAGMQIHVCSGPLSPELGIQTCCRFFLPDAWVPELPSHTAPGDNAPVNDEEDGAETPLSALKAVCVSSVDRNHRRSRASSGAAPATSCRRRYLPTPGLRVRSNETPPPPADSSFRVCQLLF